MLTASVLRDASTSYYRSADVQVDGVSLPAPQWHGKAPLGLSGEVNSRDFRSVLEGRHPFNGTRLRRDRRDARAGYDFTLSAPKSVSLLATVGGDERVIQAVSEAASEAMSFVEEEAAVQNRKTGPERTGNIVWADYLHVTGRPVKGKFDPQLHVHNVVGNFTHTASGWKGLEPTLMYKQSATVTAVFRNSLGLKLRQMGYEIEPGKNGFEVAGVPQRAIKEFSSRTGLIEKVAEGMENLTARVKGALGARTREKKAPAVKWDELKSQWEGRCKDLAAIRETVERATEREIEVRDTVVARRVQQRHPRLGERGQLLKALTQNVGEVTLEGLRSELKPHRSLRERLARHLSFVGMNRERERQIEPTLGLG